MVFLSTALLLPVALPKTTLAAVIDLNSLALVGNADVLPSGTLRLTDNTDTPGQTGPPPAGAAWTTTRFNVANPFSVSFAFQMTGFTGNVEDIPGDQNTLPDHSGGDGIAFLVQNSPQGSSAIGVGAGGMGFMNITKSVAVMFDSYQNNYYYGDPSGHYVAVNTRGDAENVPHHYCRDHMLTSDASKGTDIPYPCDSDPGLGMSGPIAFDDGNVHQATIVYNPFDLNAETLKIYLDSTLALSLHNFLFPNTISLEGGTDAYLGFTAGTRGAYENHDLLSFSYAPVPEPATGAVMAISILALAAWKRTTRISSI